MVKIVGTKRGRIFMGGSDGSLYELEYQVINRGHATVRRSVMFIYKAADAKCFPPPLPQADEGWFSKRARKINHTRSIMSALTSYW